ncbi:MAG: hypothetical protein WA718_17110 [Terriglobales bacterium]
MTGFKFKLLDRDGVLFEEVVLRTSAPEAILLGERVYLPTKKSGVYRAVLLAIAPMPALASFQGH